MCLGPENTPKLVFKTTGDSIWRFGWGRYYHDKYGNYINLDII